MQWAMVLATRRWFPIGRQSDPKAPASGYATDMPAGGENARGYRIRPWMRHHEVPTGMAGLNFGAVDGLVGIDLDFKPGEAPSDDAVDRARQRLGEIRSALTALGLRPELSHSGKGMHFFAMADEPLLTAIKGMARIPVPLVAGRRKKATAACEIFGGGNAYIAVTQRWIGDAPDELPVLSLDELRRILPEWQGQTQQALAPARPAPRREQHHPEDDATRLWDIMRQCPVPAVYDDWVKIVSIGLRAGISPDAIDAWSQTGPSYRPGEVHAKVGHEMSAPSAGWLIRYAQAHGVQVGRQASGPVTDDDIGRRRDAAFERARQEMAEEEAASGGDCSECGDPTPMRQLIRGKCRLCRHLARFGVAGADAPWCERCAPRGHYHRVGAGRCVTGSDACECDSIVARPDGRPCYDCASRTVASDAEPGEYGLAPCDRCQGNFPLTADGADRVADPDAQLLCPACVV